jgi:hypothetical protein
MPRYKSWDQIRREAAVDEDLIAAYGRLADAERRFYEARQRRGVTDAMMAQRLAIDEGEAWTVDPGEDLYLFALARHVAAAGGRLELRAVFDDEEVLLLCEPPAKPPTS